MSDLARIRQADVVYETVADRCRTCGKTLLADIGGSITGEAEALLFCPSCDALTPESSWAHFDPQLRRVGENPQIGHS